MRQGGTWVEKNSQHVCRIEKGFYCKRDIIRQTRNFAQSAGAVENTDCTSAEG